MDEKQLAQAIIDWSPALKAATGEEQNGQQLLFLIPKLDFLFKGDEFQPEESKKFAVRAKNLSKRMVLDWRSAIRDASGTVAPETVYTVFLIIQIERMYNGTVMKKDEQDRLFARLPLISERLVLKWASANSLDKFGAVISLIQQDAFFVKNAFQEQSFQKALTSGALSEAAEKARPNYSGTWKLNVEKSDVGPFPPVKYLTKRIRHENLSLQVLINQGGEQGELSADLKYIINGERHVNRMAGQEVESRVKWSGDTLQIRSIVEISGTLFVIIDEWALSKDGRVLTVNRHQSAPEARDFKQVFEKQ